jgi:enamine deaminase RidA (YjgF/YER057c/UK114 family)
MQYSIDFFKVSLSKANLSFKKNIASLMLDIKDKKNVVNLVFFGISADEKYDEDLQIIRSLAEGIFEENIPLITYITQTPDAPNEIALEIFYRPPFILSLSYQETDGVRYALMETAKSRILITEGINSDEAVTGSQANDIFTKAAHILKNQKMQTKDIVRQWNYIGQITGMTGGIQHYQTFNDARADFYRDSNWKTNGYPAATGIGMSANRLIVSFIAMSPFDDQVQIQPLNNSLQTPAHAYSEKVLVCTTGNERHATPKFERAKIIKNDSFGICFISGTAAIRGEQSMNSMDAALQTRQTLENIQYLISDKNLEENGIGGKVSIPSLLRVYVKYGKDMDAVKNEVGKVWPQIPAVYLEAGICREELLVEIEGVATVV